MGRYDITLRHLTRIGDRAFLRAIGGEGRLTLLQTDFPTTRDRQVDFLAVLDSPDGRRQLLHIEFQSAPDRTMAARMLGYYSDILGWLIARGQDGLGVLPHEIVQKVVYVGAREWQPETAIRHRNLDFQFEYIVASELDARPLLETGDLGDAIIAVLSADGTDPKVIKAILNKVARAPDNERADALAQLIALSELRGIRPLIEREFHAMPITVSVEDSTILRPPIDRAYAIGKAEGKAEGQALGRAEGQALGKAEGQALGKAEGQALGKAEAIATILKQRFPGQVRAGLVDRLALVAAETLDEILHNSLTATSIADALGNAVPADESHIK